MSGQSFSVEVTSLNKFAQELQTQLDGIGKPMTTLTAQSETEPQFGAFTEAWMLGQSQQSAVQEMCDLLGQVKQAIGFAEKVTTTIASAYQNADEDAAASYEEPGTTSASGSGTTSASGSGTATTSGSGTTTTSGSGTTTTSGSGTTTNSPARSRFPRDVARRLTPATTPSVNGTTTTSAPGTTTPSPVVPTSPHHPTP
jgi:hypothetical protein